MPGTFSVPERMAFCCPPPKINGFTFAFFFKYINPVPFGPWILCPLTVNTSMLLFFGLISIFPKAWIASTWYITFLFIVLMYLPISSIGWMAPTSLFTYIMETKIVSSVIASFSSSSWTTPSWSTGKYVTSYPSCSKCFIGLFTDACSTFVVMIFFPLLLLASTAPIIAQLFDSVPPDVK